MALELKESFRIRIDFRVYDQWRGGILLPNIRSLFGCIHGMRKRRILGADCELPVKNLQYLMFYDLTAMMRKQ